MSKRVCSKKTRKNACGTPPGYARHNGPSFFTSENVSAPCPRAFLVHRMFGRDMQLALYRWRFGAVREGGRRWRDDVPSVLSCPIIFVYIRATFFHEVLAICRRALTHIRASLRAQRASKGNGENYPSKETLREWLYLSCT